MKKITIALLAIFIVLLIVYAAKNMRISAVEDKHFTNSIGMEMIALSDGYWVSKYETTQEQFKMIMGYNPSQDPGVKKPVEKLTSKEAEEFCVKLTKHEQAKGTLPDGFVYTLPSYREWIRFVDDASLENAIVPCSKKKFESGTMLVGSGEVNRLGVYDLRGNVAEYSRDKHSSTNTNCIFGASFLEHRKDFLPVRNKASFMNATDASLHVGFRCVLIREEGSMGTVYD